MRMDLTSQPISCNPASTFSSMRYSKVARLLRAMLAEEFFVDFFFAIVITALIVVIDLKDGAGQPAVNPFDKRYYVNATN